MRFVVFCLVLLLLSPADAVSGSVADRPEHDDANLHAVARVGTRLAWVVGDRGLAWSSQDSGRTWEPVRLPGHIACRSVCFLSDRVGWIAGNDERPGHGHGVVLATRDGGGTWKSIASPLIRISHLRFFDLDHGILVGDGGEECPCGVVITNDGGSSWQAVAGHRSHDWRAAAFSSLGNGVVAGGGLRQGQLADGVLLENDPSPHGRRAWWGAALAGDVAERPHGTGWLVGDAATVLTRPPGTTSWQTPETPLPVGLNDAMTFRCVAAVGQEAWIAGSPGSVIWHTPDGGRRWERQTTGQSLPLYAISMNPTGVGLAVGALGVIIRTTDRGRHWKVVRGEGRRLAMLVIHVTTATLPLGILAHDSWELGYRSAGVVVTASTEQWRRADRTVRALGGQGVEAGWRLGLDQPELTRNADQLERSWQTAAEGRLDDWLVGRFAGLIRTWRPSVVTCDAAEPDDRAAQLVHAALEKAAIYASDPTRLAIRSSLCGLTPWTVRRRLERTLGDGAAVVRVDPQTALSRHGEVIGTLVQRSLLGRTQDDSLDWQGDRLRRLEGSGRSNSSSACQGLGLSQGSAARRMLAKPDAVAVAQAESHRRRTRAIEVWIRMAESGSRPLTSLGAELTPLLKAMSPEQAGWHLWRLAGRFQKSGRLPISEVLLNALVQEYPDHEAALAATRILLASTVSRERRWQRIRYAVHQETLAAPRPSVTGNGVKLAGAEMVSRTRSRPLAIAGKADWQSAMTGAEVTRAIRLARNLKQHATRAYEAGSTQLTLAALFRSRGSHRLADTCYRRLGARAGPWRATAIQETWLANRIGNPSADSVVCRSVATRPILDGVISDICWEAVPEMRLRDPQRTVPTSDSGFVLTTCDHEYLYLAARLERATTTTPDLATARTFDADHTGHDRLTIFLDTDRDYQVGYEITIDERGKVSESCGGDPSWNPRMFVAIDADRTAWRFELAIRWSDLVPARPPAGRYWGLRLVRTIPAIGWQGWGGTYDQRGGPAIGAGLLTFSGDRSVRRRTESGTTVGP